MLISKRHTAHGHGVLPNFHVLLRTQGLSFCCLRKQASLQSAARTSSLNRHGWHLVLAPRYMLDLPCWRPDERAWRCSLTYCSQA